MNTSLLVSTIRVHGAAKREVMIVKWIAIQEVCFANLLDMTEW